MERKLKVGDWVRVLQPDYPLTTSIYSIYVGDMVQVVEVLQYHVYVMNKRDSFPYPVQKHRVMFCHEGVIKT